MHYKQCAHPKSFTPPGIWGCRSLVVDVGLAPLFPIDLWMRFVIMIRFFVVVMFVVGLLENSCSVLIFRLSSLWMWVHSSIRCFWVSSCKSHLL